MGLLDESDDAIREHDNDDGEWHPRLRKTQPIGLQKADPSRMF